jgi:excisionase family DNA binding protein
MLRIVKNQLEDKMSTAKTKEYLTVPEAANLLNISKNAVLVAIKTKKLNAKRDGYYWKIPIKTLQAYKALRKKALLKSERVRGIDSKAIAISILEREITKTGFKNIKITKNFEMFRGSSLKPLIDERSVAAASIHLLHSTLYEKFENRFFYDDIEMDFEKFMQRLLRVKDFLERVKVEPKKLSAIKAMIKTTHSLSTKWIKLEACTGRLFSDQGPVFFGTKSSGQTQELVRSFCSQGEFTVLEVLDTLKALA